MYVFKLADMLCAVGIQVFIAFPNSLWASNLQQSQVWCVESVDNVQITFFFSLIWWWLIVFYMLYLYLWGLFRGVIVDWINCSRECNWRYRSVSEICNRNDMDGLLIYLWISEKVSMFIFCVLTTWLSQWLQKTADFKIFYFQLIFLRLQQFCILPSILQYSNFI